MWLCTQCGFFSVVQKKPGEYHIRARRRSDLESLQTLCGASWEIIKTVDGDYRYRVVCDLPVVLAAIDALGRDLDYSNFKGRIQTLSDQREKAHAYGNLWSDLYALQK